MLSPSVIKHNYLRRGGRIGIYGFIDPVRYMANNPGQAPYEAIPVYDLKKQLAITRAILSGSTFQPLADKHISRKSILARIMHMASISEVHGGSMFTDRWTNYPQFQNGKRQK